MIEVLDSSYFQESLSVEEYPRVKVLKDSFGMFKVKIGASVYSEIDGDLISALPTVGMEKSYSIVNQAMSEIFTISVMGRPGMRTGSLYGADYSSAIVPKNTLIAELNCN